VACDSLGRTARRNTRFSLVNYSMGSTDAPLPRKCLVSYMGPRAVNGPDDRGPRDKISTRSAALSMEIETYLHMNWSHFKRQYSVTQQLPYMHLPGAKI
jgi:hypothetical protein